MAALKTLGKIKTIARNYPEPVNYFNGIDAFLEIVPQKVLLFHRDHQMGTESQIHYRFVLIAVLEQAGNVIVDGEMFHLEPGQGMLIFPHQSHHYTRFLSTDKVSWLFTTFEHDRAVVFERLLNTPFTYNEQDQERLLRLSNAFYSWLKNQEDIGQEAPLELSLLLSSLIRRQKSHIKKAGGKTTFDSPKHEFIQKITRYICQNLDRPLNTNDLAKIVSLSPSRFRVKFREAININLGEFIRRTRIHKACGLLHSSDLSITEISKICGFDSLYSFSRTFKNLIGKSPNLFRKDIRG